MSGTSELHIQVCRIILIFVLTLRFGIEGVVAATLLEIAFETCVAVFLISKGRG